ncbi:hypothetical protein BJY04DRAFT_223371 [Aspergillus karnatakaensis]|uniref:uncharacterized protein n=1 Tax=Aspergillus karnatakaensis TaxID=1810916 RepID=UPI003CCCC22E
MPTPGILMRLSETPPNAPPQSVTVEAIYTLGAKDDKAPSQNTLYFLTDIEPLLSTRDAYNADIAAHPDQAISWILCSFINGRDPNSTAAITTPHVPTSPLPNSTLVINGSTPKPEAEADYHAWYDQEHGGKLALVPGWKAMRRYKQEKVYGEAETANFYGVNIYDEENGLGGPEWKAGVTDWTMRIRSNAAKPNVRRVWRVLKTE